MKNPENKKSTFIQLTKPNENLVRYFCIGNYDNDNLFTGHVYGYEGGGEFSDQFIYKNKFLPEYDTTGEPLDWECNEELFNFLSIDKFDDLDNSIRKILDFDCTLQQWYVLDEKLSIFDGTNLYTENINCYPPSYGLTTWDGAKLETWKIVDLKIEIKNHSKAVLLEYCSDHIEHHKAFPMDLIVLSDNEYEVKIEFSEYESILGDDFKKLADYIFVSENDIKGIAKEILLSDSPDIIACKTLDVGVKVMIKTKDEKVIQCIYIPVEDGDDITIQSAKYM